MNSSNVSGHGLIDNIVVIAFCLYAFWCGKKKPVNILYILPAAVSYYFFIDFITLLTPIKLVPAFFLIGNALGERKKYLAKALENYWIVIVIYLLIVTSSLGFIYTISFRNDLGYNPLQRFLVQIITNINYILIYAIVVKTCEDDNSFKVFCRGYIFFTTILCLYGIYQIIAYKLGLPLRGIVYSSRKVGIVVEEASGLLRINSLGNEPKRLGYFLFFGFLLLIFSKKTFNYKTSIYYTIVALHFVTSFLPFSTSFFGILIIFLCLVTVISVLIQKKVDVIKKMLFVFLTLAIFVAFNLDTLNKYYNGRFATQKESLEAERDYVDPIAFELLQEQPSFVILGVGPGNYNFILKEYKGVGVSEYGLDIMDSAILNNIYDFGIFGILIFFIPILRLFLNTNKYYNKKIQGLELVLLLFIGSTCIFLLAWPFYFIVVAFFDGLRKKIEIIDA